MAKTVEIIITAKNGTTNTIRQVANDLDEVDDASQKASQGLNKTASSFDRVNTEARTSSSRLKELRSGVLNLASAYAGLETVTAAASFAWDGFTLGAGIEQSQMAVQTLTGSVEKGNAVFKEAIAFGQRYGYTQQEMASAASQASAIFTKTNQTTEKTLEVLGRLASINPAEGFEGAVIAFKELASGDITSIAERFNIARSEANAMKDAIASGADPVATLDAALAKMGVTVDVLGNRMEGRNKALLDMKLSMESLSLASGNLLEALNIGGAVQNFANGVNGLAQGINVLTGDTQELTNAVVDLQTRGFALGNYDLYVQKMQEAGLADEILSREAYNAAGALISKGTAANTASAGVVGLADAEAVLRDMLLQQVNAGQISEGQMSNLIQRTMELAATNPTVSASLLEMITQMSDSGASASELTQYLDALSINQEFAASTAYGYADAQQAAYDATVQSTDAAAVHTATIFQLSDAEYENAEAKLQQGLAAERSIQFEQDLALAVAMSADGALDAEIASIRLAQAYGIERSEAANLIAMTNQLNASRSGRMGSIAGNALEGALNMSAGMRSGAITAPYVKRSSRGGGGGGKSPEVKEREKTEKELDKAEKKITEARERYLEKREQLERDHAARVADINRKAIEERLKAERTLQTNQFDSRADFYTYVAGLDQSQRQEAIARYEELWATQAKLVEQGKIKEAEAYRQAAQEELQADLERAAAMRDIQAQLADETANLTQAQRDDLAEQLLLLQQSDRIYDDQAKARLDGIKNSADSIEQARQEELAKEQGDYAEAGAKIKDEFDSVVRDVVDDAGQLADAVRQMADRLAVEAGRIIDAANSVGGYAGSGNVEAGSDMAALNVPSFDVGTGDAGLPHNMLLYGHEREIIATPRQSDQVRGLGGLDSLIRTGQQQRQQRPSASDAMIRDSGPSSSRAGTGGGGVSMPIQVVVNGAGGAAPMIDVGLLKRDIEAAVNKRLDEDRKRKIMRG